MVPNRESNIKNNNDKTKFAQNLINTHITYVESPEQRVAMKLFNFGVTEGEFLEMQKLLNCGQPTIVNIANHLRDSWRCYSQERYDNEQ
jgi:hypothetical protein